MEFLAKRFNVDLEKLDAVAKFLSTPSVRQNSAVCVVTKDGEEKQIMKVNASSSSNLRSDWCSKAVWMEPRVGKTPV